MTAQQFYVKYDNLAWRVARTMQRSYGLSEEDTEDIHAAIWVKLSALPARLRRETPYVRTVINNTARSELTYIRKHERIESYDQLLMNSCHSAVALEGGWADLAFQVADSRPNPEEELIHADLIEKYLSILSPQERSIVNLLLGRNGLPPMGSLDISMKLGMPWAEVNSILENTYERMREFAEIPHHTRQSSTPE